MKTLELRPRPMDRPPNEILALIFKVAADLPLGRRELPVPLVLAGVSRRWRDVAISNPELWTTIRVSGCRSLSHATLFLTRSAPLSFRLSVNTENTTHLDAARLCNIILPHIHRCTALALCVSDPELSTWNTTLQSQFTSLPLRLLSLTIHSHAPDELWGPPRSMYAFLASCTALSSLRLSMAPTADAPLSMGLARGLTTLNVRCTWDGLFLRHLLLHTPVLQTLVLRNYSFSVFAPALPVPAPTVVTVRIPSLTSLTLEYRDAALAEGLLALTQFADLPTLARLCIKGSGVPPASAPAPTDANVDAVPHPWFPRLCALRLEDIPPHAGLRAAPVLQTLAARITSLRLVDAVLPPFNAVLPPFIATPHFDDITTETPRCPLSLTGYPHLRVVEVTPTGGTPLILHPRGAVPISVSTLSLPTVPGELDFYASGEFEERDSEADAESESAHAHACSDFCLLHTTNQGAWRDVRTEAQRAADVELGVGFAADRLEVQRAADQLATQRAADQLEAQRAADVELGIRRAELGMSIGRAASMDEESASMNEESASMNEEGASMSGERARTNEERTSNGVGRGHTCGYAWQWRDVDVGVGGGVPILFM